MFRQLLTLGNKFKLNNRSIYQFASKEVAKSTKQQGAKKDVTQYVEGQIVNRTQITLKKKEDIEAYVVKLVRNYFRTTNKQSVNIESTLRDHGLDEFDSIELSMQVEEDLGYVISAETLPVLNKVKHFVNYIHQVEQFKQENNGQDPIA